MNQVIVFIILDLFVCGILIYCLFMPALVSIIKMKKYEKVKGIIIDKEIKIIETTDAGGKFAHYKYQFTYQNKIYQIEDKAFNPNKRLNIGDEVIIYIKSGNPKIYLYPDIVRNRYIYLFLSLLGIVHLSILLVAIFRI